MVGVRLVDDVVTGIDLGLVYIGVMRIMYTKANLRIRLFSCVISTLFH